MFLLPHLCVLSSLPKQAPLLAAIVSIILYLNSHFLVEIVTYWPTNFHEHLHNLQDTEQKENVRPFVQQLSISRWWQTIVIAIRSSICPSNLRTSLQASLQPHEVCQLMISVSIQLSSVPMPRMDEWTFIYWIPSHFVGLCPLSKDCFGLSLISTNQV